MTENNNKKGRPRRYMFWSDWEVWLLKEWYPFKQNEWSHMKRDIVWIKYLVGGMILTLIGAAITILTKGN